MRSGAGIGDSLIEDETKHDPYSIHLVDFELRMRSGGKRAIHGYTQKRLPGLCDLVSVALLKTLSRERLLNAQTVRDFLPIIENAFAQPQGIDRESDKKPSVTLFLLDYLKQEIKDTEVQQDIARTA